MLTLGKDTMNVRLTVYHNLPCHINDVLGTSQHLSLYTQVLSDTEKFLKNMNKGQLDIYKQGMNLGP